MSVIARNPQLQIVSAQPDKGGIISFVVDKRQGEVDLDAELVGANTKLGRRELTSTSADEKGASYCS